MTIKLSKLFTIRYGHSLELNRLAIKPKEEGGIAFVSRKMGDNGIAAYVNEIKNLTPNPGGELTCALSGNGVLSTFVQDNPYYTGFHVACLRPLIPLDKSQLLYYCACIAANRYKYSWGRQANRTLSEIILPDLSEIPNWVSQSDADMFDGAELPTLNVSSPSISTIFWQPFKISSLFDVKKGKRLTKANMLPGIIPFIGAIDSNNGLSAFVGQEAIHEANTITVNYNGNGVAEAFYQPEPFWATDDVNVLYPKFKLTPAIALFIATLIRLEKYRFNYGRKWHMERMKESCIRLPVKSDNAPDWEFMEQYIKSLPYSSQIESA